MIKKISALLLAGALAFSLTACGKEDSVTPPGGNAPAASSGAASSGSGELTGLTEAFAEGPVLLTTGGQSADYQMVGTLMKNLGMEYELNNVATSADLGDAKTLVVVVGGSSKGLGAAGIDANAELKRVEELVGAADEKGLSILAVHIGGEARRGDLSDQFIAPSFEKADYALVVADGDKDGLMAGLAAEKGIPIDVVTSMAEAVPKLGAAFKQE